MINMRDVCQERNLLEVRRKIDYVNQWLKERTVVVDETMKEEHNATGFDQSAAPGKDLITIADGDGEDVMLLLRFCLVLWSCTGMKKM
ncbi:hypothetical protein NC652_009488 [Populus alba x Populus x berolinensis]|nr:hypothetical protein NC652_009488 [Populus alba x Populus x berolinensis]